MFCTTVECRVQASLGTLMAFAVPTSTLAPVVATGAAWAPISAVAVVGTVRKSATDE